MRYIHSLSTTLRWRKYRENIIVAVSGVVLIGTLYVGYNAVTGGLGVTKTKKEVATLTETNKTKRSTLSNIKVGVENAPEYEEFKTSEGELGADKIPTYYGVDKVYDFIHTTPDTIKVTKVDINSQVFYIKGQALSYKQLELYREDLKASELFSLIEIKELDYITTGDFVQFELRCLIKEPDEAERKELEKSEGRDKS